MKTAKRRFFLLFFSILFGLMMGVQLMSEHAGLNEPKPLNIEFTAKKEEDKPQLQTDSAQEEVVEKKPLTTDREEKGLSNLFSDLGSALADQTEGATRSGLEKVVSIVQGSVNKDDR
ncbi:hypothetical protein [Shouchella miscanthi]|uniref:Uncharacterized protein n=1 Tax=Shouchella miscanthi TaxID=2598861 RepID=A0ABU6NM78_9BACI|nr:hypothetical protein [Shouchella miscanthi]MED4127862.1 hypothetical protein [Shouchella miscanthi]